MTWIYIINSFGHGEPSYLKVKGTLKCSLYILKILCSIIFLEVNLSFRKIPGHFGKLVDEAPTQRVASSSEVRADTLPQVPARGPHCLGFQLFCVSARSAPWPLEHCVWTQGPASGQGGDFPNEYVQTDPTSLPETSHHCQWQKPLR